MILSWTILCTMYNVLISRECCAQVTGLRTFGGMPFEDKFLRFRFGCKSKVMYERRPVCTQNVRYLHVAVQVHVVKVVVHVQVHENAYTPTYMFCTCTSIICTRLFDMNKL